MRLAYYTDPARHQRIANTYRSKHYINNSNDANSKNTDNNNNITLSLQKSTEDDVMQ